MIKDFDIILATFPDGKQMRVPSYLHTCDNVLINIADASHGSFISKCWSEGYREVTINSEKVTLSLE